MNCSKIKAPDVKFIDGWIKDCTYSNQLLTKLAYLNKYLNIKIDIFEIKKAIYFAKKYHGNQLRNSGELYYSHPLKVACIVSDYLPRTNAVVVSILHDTIEDTLLTKELIAANFGATIANQIEDLTRNKSDRKITSAQIIELLCNQQKHDVLLIKLVDRLHNIQTLRFKTKEQIKKTAIETLEFFIKPALHLGIRNIALELQKLCNLHLGLVINDFCI